MKNAVCHVHNAMSLYDDVIYLGLLISSILVGTFLRPPNLPSSSIAARKWLSSAIGLAIVFLVSGLHGLHCFAALALQGCQPLLSRVSCHLRGIWQEKDRMKFIDTDETAYLLRASSSPSPPHPGSTPSVSSRSSPT